MYSKKMSRFLLVALLVPAFLTDAIYLPGDDVTKPPKHRENLQWPPNHPNYVPASPQPPVNNRPSGRSPDAGYRDIVLVHTAGGSRQTGAALCPEKATGQFTYVPDCRKFINCWKGRGFIQACAPGTLFNPKSLECDFPGKVKCLAYEDERESEPLKEEVLEPEVDVKEPEYVESGMIDVRVAREDDSSPSSSSSVVHRTSSVSQHSTDTSSGNHQGLSPSSSQTAGRHPSSTLYPNLDTRNPPSYPDYQSPTAFPKQLPSPLNPVSNPSRNPPIDSKVPSDSLAHLNPQSQTTENPPRHAGYPASGINHSPSPWLQPPPTSNYPAQNQGRFPARQPHSLNPPGVGYNTDGKNQFPSPLHPPPGNYPSYSQNQPHLPNNQPQYPGSYPQSSGNQQQSPGYQPQYPGSYPQSSGNQQQSPGYQPQYPGSYPQSSGNQQQSHGYQPQYPGSYPQSSSNHQQSPGYQPQYPGSYPQSSGNQRQSPGYQPQYPGRYPQSSSNHQQSPGYQPQYPGSYPQSSSNHRQSPGSYHQTSRNQQYYPESSPQPVGNHQPQYSGTYPETSRNQPLTTEKYPLYPVGSPTVTTTPHGKDLATKHKSECSMPGGSGVAPHPTDCKKFLNCWKGSAHTQSCAPGTLFNPVLLQCDHPFNVVCRRNTDSQEPGPGKKWTPPPGSLQSATPPVFSGRDGADATSPTRVNFNPPGTSPVPPTAPTQKTDDNVQPYDLTHGSNRPVYNSYPSNASGYGESPSYSPPFSSNPSNPSGHGSNPFYPPPYNSNPSRSYPSYPAPNGSNLPTYNSHLTSKSPIQSSYTSTTSSGHGLKPYDSPSQGSKAFYPPSSSSQTTRYAINTTPHPLTTTPRHRTLTTEELPLIHEASDIQTYYEPVSGHGKTNKSSWLPEPTSITQKLSTLQATALREAPKPPTTRIPTFRVLTTAKTMTTTKMPTNIMSIPGPSYSQSKPSSKQPATTTRPNIGYSPSLMTSGQEIRLRGGPAPFEGYVEVQGSSPGWGLVCDEANGWNIDEASVVCRQLGYVRGAELSWQGRPVRPTEDTIRVSVSEVKCSGSEESLFSCRVSRGAGQCLIPRDAVGVRCYRNHASVCQPEEINHGGKCYSVIVPREDTALEAFSHGEALADCQKRKAKLLDITSQTESDFISELLLQSYPHINSIITSGVGVKVMGHPLWIWEGSGESFRFQKWWPGWTGNETVPTASSGADRMQCVVAKRVFPCQAPYLPDVIGLANLCEANYFYWATEDCSLTHGHPYVCERSHDDIGCVTKAGQDYMGVANISSTGGSCLPWDSPLTPASLKYRMAYKVRQTTMAGHNHCRNIGGGETHPWCYVGPQAQFQYCDIPKCRSAGETGSQCGLGNFECRPRKCIPSSWVCDGENDCSNAKDELDCTDVKATDEGRECSAVEFECRPGKCIPATWLCDGDKDCVDGKDEINCPALQQTTLIPSSGATQCGLKEFECRPGECISATLVCNRKVDCSNGKDEQKCSGTSECDSNEFECHSREVIIAPWVCDGETDCSNGRDELNCTGVKKPGGSGSRSSLEQFECRPKECVLASKVCDGTQDCSNGRDEKECKVGENMVDDIHNCSMKEFECEPGNCIPSIWACDGVEDCPEGNDENNCQGIQKAIAGGLKCSSKEFECRPGECVLATWVCDGAKDCSNGRDEKDCSGP